MPKNRRARPTGHQKMNPSTIAAIHSGLAAYQARP
jgi:hypothetical protein